jgi:hypothetical protein
MAHTRRTLKLEPQTWDLACDGSGRIAVAAGAAATAQNVANEARLFTEDAYFCRDKGLPHFAASLGSGAAASLLRSYLRDAALKVPDVAEVQSVEVGAAAGEARQLAGDIRFKTKEENEHAAIRTYF